MRAGLLSDRVLKDYIGKYYISTVKLDKEIIGMDTFCGIGTTPDMLYETIVFDNDLIEKEGNWMELYIDKYATKKEAIKGHEKAVEWVKQRIKCENSIREAVEV